MSERGFRGVHCRGYVRVSTSKQADEGHSIDQQVDAINKAIADINLKRTPETAWRLAKMYIDRGVSGTTIEREGYKQMLQDLAQGEYIITYGISRLGRNIIESMNNVAELANKGAFIYAVDVKIDTGTSTGRVMYGVLASLASDQAEQISKATSDVLINMSQRGFLRSKAPFGYVYVSANVDHAPHPGEQECLDAIIKYVESVDPTKRVAYTGVSNYLNENKYYMLTKDNTPEKVAARNNKYRLFNATKVKNIMLLYSIVALRRPEEMIRPHPSRRINTNLIAPSPG